MPGWTRDADIARLPRAERTIFLAANCNAKVLNDGVDGWLAMVGEHRIGTTATALRRVGAQNAADVIARLPRLLHAYERLEAAGNDVSDHSRASWKRHRALQRRVQAFRNRLDARYSATAENVRCLVITFAREALRKDPSAFAWRSHRPPVI
ncbi:MAG: hypothetical protein V4617_11090 [Gemmatimonadota bacterium]